MAQAKTAAALPGSETPRKGGERRITKKGDDGILTRAEIERRYPDEWVLLEIVRDHRDPMRVAGRVLAHSPSRDDLDGPFARFRAEHPQAPTYEFYTGDIAPPDVVVIL